MGDLIEEKIVAQKTRILVRSQLHEHQSRPGGEKTFKREEHHIVDLDQDIIHRHISPPMLICSGIGMSSMVSFGDSVYMFGGCKTPDEVTELASYKSLNPDDTFYTGSAKLQIVNHDDWKLSGLWRENQRMLLGPSLPRCICLNGKIYSFGFVKFCPEVFDPIRYCWEGIPFPSEYKGCNVSVSVLPDVSANRIILGLTQVEGDSPPPPSLHAFHPATNHWETIVSNSDFLCEAATIADDVIYFNYRYCPTLICAYDLKNLKWLNVHCSVITIDGWHISALKRYHFRHFFSLGDNTFCLAIDMPVIPKSIFISYSHFDDDDDNDNDDTLRKCRLVFFKFKIERRDSTVNLVPQLVRSFILPRTSCGRGMVLLS